MSAKRPMKNCRSLLPSLRMADIRLDADFDNAKSDEDVIKAIAEYKKVMEQAAVAFFEDTKDVNSLDTIRSIVVKPGEKFSWMSVRSFLALAGIEDKEQG